MIRPSPLKPGDRLAVIGGSSPIAKTEEELVRAVRDMGLEPVIFPSALAKHEYLSGPDALRAHDINAAFADESIAGIVQTRGGYGSLRVLPLLDLELIRRHPKFYGGYSDVTAYLNVFTRFCGFEAYHMPMVGAWADGMDPYTKEHVKAVLFGGKMAYENPEGYPMRTLVGGTAEGELCGGNLALTAETLGTPWEVDVKGKILFVEAVHGAPERLDGLLTKLRNAGKLEQMAGLLVGQITDVPGDPEVNARRLEMILQELVVPAGKPVITGVMCGHGVPTMTLPIGRRFRMDADKRVFGEI